MDETLKPVHTEVIEEAIRRLSEEKPELTLMFENAKETLMKVGEYLLQCWDKVKEFFKNLAGKLTQVYGRVYPVIEYYGNQQKRVNYRANLHDFLGTNQYQRNKAFTHSSIYYKSGRK